MKFILFSLFFLISCTKKQSAEETLYSFVKYRFKENQSKDILLSQTTGILFKKIEDMDADTFKKFITNKQLKLKKYKVDLIKCTDIVCFITYTLSYNQTDKSGPKYLTEIKKIAELQLEGGLWKIADVSNIKTYIDSKRPLNSAE